MKVFLAGTLNNAEIRRMSIYCLDSFWEYAQYKTPRPCDNAGFKDYLLDSGAFTFMYGGKTHDIDWTYYTDRLADFVKSYNVKHYFELDIDSVIGYGAVRRLRDRLESRVGWQSIPVWHVSRGKDDFISMCRDYGYVATGGIAGKQVRKQAKIQSRYFKFFIDEAHRNGARIHGLGITSEPMLHMYKFDSVDSTSWVSYGRYGGTFKKFNGRGFDNIRARPGQRRADIPGGMSPNTLQGLEWIKFQKYADENL